MARTGKREQTEITILGITYPPLSTKRAMWTVAKAALEAGIGPNALRLHDGLPSAKSRWMGPFSKAGALVAIRGLGKKAERWYAAATDLLVSNGETWILTDQWSWDHARGSSKDDLERIQRLHPQLGLSWRRLP